MIRKTIVMDKHLLYEVNRFAEKDQRDFSNTVRYATRIGLVALENPDLTVGEIKDILEARLDAKAKRVSPLDPDDL